jgi:hypothetical protein
MIDACQLHPHTGQIGQSGEASIEHESTQKKKHEQW